MKGDWPKLGMGMSLPATDGKAIYFFLCFEIILLFFLVFVLNSYYSQNKNQSSKDSSPNSCFKNSTETCGWEKQQICKVYTKYRIYLLKPILF